MRNSIIVATLMSLVLLNTVTGIVSCNNWGKLLISKEKATFFDAYVRCRQHGLIPVEIIQEEDEQEIENALQNETNYGWNNGFWIFATNLGDSKNYYWLGSGKPLIYSQFETSQPNNPQSENCLEIVRVKADVYVWHDVPCNTKFRFICKYPI